ncbi:hypothetical protein JCM11641_005994 [Rhodosporidiobolus odoratus]
MHKHWCKKGLGFIFAPPLDAQEPKAIEECAERYRLGQATELEKNFFEAYDGPAAQMLRKANLEGEHWTGVDLVLIATLPDNGKQLSELDQTRFLINCRHVLVDSSKQFHDS